MSIFINDKLKIKNNTCYCCEGNNTKPLHLRTWLGTRYNTSKVNEWETVYYYQHMLHCFDCNLNVPQKEDKIIKAYAKRLAEIPFKKGS